MTRMLLIISLFAATAALAFTYRNPEAVARASDNVAAMLRDRASSKARAVQIARGQGGEFALRARINGAAAPMVIDTGATSVVLTYETAKGRGPAARTPGIQRRRRDGRRSHQSCPADA